MYVGIFDNEGIEVSEEEAFQYALERCQNGTLEEVAEFKEMLTGWYYSGNWLRRNENAQKL